VLLVFLVFVASADRGDEVTTSLAAALTQALGPDASVVLDVYRGPPPTDMALAQAAHERRAGAVARISWSDPDHTRVAADLFVTARGDLLHRELTFTAHDSPAERGRAVGLVLAALLRGARGPEARGPDPASPPSSAAVAAAVDHKEVAGGPHAIEGFGHLAVALGGAGTGLGGGLAARIYGTNGWGARLGLHARGGSVAEAQATSLSVALALGGLRTLRDGGGPGWDLAARADLLLLYEAITHFSDDDPSPVRQGRFLPGAAALLEAQWRWAPGACLHLGLGLEAAFGATRIVVRGSEVTTVVPVRSVFEAGLRASF
jgi:hypothetical protein